MKQISVGKQGCSVSQQGLGLMGMSAFYASAKHTSEEKAIALIHHAIDKGITHFDTAQFYGANGENESVLGKALKTKNVDRDSIVIATKGGIDPVAIKPDGRPEFIRASVDESLKRLGTDHLDLFTLTRIDTSYPLEKTMEELKKLVQEKKIYYLGLSEASVKSIRTAHAIHPISTVQIEWSLFARDFEPEIIPVCRELGIGIVAYSPLGKGILTGAVKTKNYEADDFRNHVPRLADNFDSVVERVSQLEPIAAAKKCSVGQLALAWLHHQGDDVCPIPGTTSAGHLDDNVAALDVKLTAAEVESISKLFPVGCFAGGRYPSGSPTFESN